MADLQVAASGVERVPLYGVCETHLRPRSLLTMREQSAVR